MFTFIIIQTLCSYRIRSDDFTEVPIKILPLSIFSAVDIVMGIAGTGSLRTKRSIPIYLSVIVMVIGAVIAAIGDITFDPIGYTYILINNISTTGKALLTKSRLRDYDFSSVELLYFNSLLMLPILFILVYVQCDFTEVRNFLLTNTVPPEKPFHGIIQFEHWLDPLFLLYFMFSCCSAVALNYTLVQCTQYTSALTTSILGVIKNILVTYGGMFVGGDYVYTTLNFAGLTVRYVKFVV
ncbi:unnamed protein product [Schistosoma margrebowiei]|uniref:Uncharacterized protein n=1 Tax=Schistosoma margrebowiei TaxID=48269 RepID=A0A3P8D5Q6_9TREM|nr:unnamed protein product [Schistosoma margrebowiei]